MEKEDEYKIEIVGYARDLEDFMELLRDNDIRFILLKRRERPVRRIRIGKIVKKEAPRLEKFPRRAVIAPEVVIGILSLSLTTLKLIWDWYKDRKEKTKIRIITKAGTKIALDAKFIKEFELKERF